MILENQFKVHTKAVAISDATPSVPIDLWLRMKSFASEVVNHCFSAITYACVVSAELCDATGIAHK